ncbi:MAG: hypothetical protein ABMA00_01100 [Gemmatimonas sp.]
MTKSPKKGKRAGSGSASKRTTVAIEKKFGAAARKAAERGGRKPSTWAQPDRSVVRNTARTESPDDLPSDNLDIAVSRSLEASASEVFRAFHDPTRRSWSAVRDFVVRTTIAPRLLRIGMRDGTLVTVTIARNGNSRCAVTVEHHKLPDERTAEQAKSMWREALARLADLLAD